MTLFDLYLYFVLVPHLSHVGTFFTVIGSIALLINLTIYHLVDNSDRTTYAGRFKSMFIISIPVVILGAVLTMLPNGDQVKFLAGGYIVTNTDGVAELPSNVVKAANDYLSSIQKEAAQQ